VHSFSVWAPAADRVMLHLPGLDRREPMSSTDDTGWWRVDVEAAGPGTDYAFAVDGGPPRPDPRSAWQPSGVHEPSRVFDASAFAWSDSGWGGRTALGSVFYELHVGTFTPEGTLAAAVEHLDHLVELGVDFVELLPVAAFSGSRGWGYDGVGLYAVHAAYGGPQALQEFVDAAHARGLGVCLDVVYNHLGPDGNYLRDFGPYFTVTHNTPWGEAVNLDDEGAAGVRAFIIDNAVRWLRDFHVDCLRLDAVHALVDESGRHLLAELSDEVAALAEELGRPLALVAESDLNDPVMIEPVAEGGLGMTAQWDDDVHHALHTWLTGERQGYYGDFGSSAVLARVLTEAFRHAGDYSSFRGRHWGHPIDPARHDGHRFVAALQNHDQIGNRATGDRLSATLSPGRLAAGAALLLTSAYTPLLFMGEEWGASTPWQFFTSFDDPDLGDAVRRGRRAEFAGHGWREDEVPDPQDPATRDRSVLDWTEPAGSRVRPSDGVELPHARLLQWYRDLIRLRRDDLALHSGDLRRVGVEFGDTWLVTGRDGLATAVNLGPGEAVLPVPSGSSVELGWGDVGWDGSPSTRDGTLRLGADSVAVVRVARSDVWTTIEDDGTLTSSSTAPPSSSTAPPSSSTAPPSSHAAPPSSHAAPPSSHAAPPSAGPPSA
jgi:maltooligosyltrehalose trehalohydrolase